MQTRIERRNGTLLVPVPAALAAQAGIAEDSVVELTSDRGRLVVAPIAHHNLTLNDLLAAITDENLHAEIDSGPPVGAEAW